MLRNLWNGFCELFFPSNCILCHKGLTPEEKNLCHPCQKNLTSNFPPFCESCSRHVDDNGQRPFCRECRTMPHQFDRAWSAMLYNETMKQLMHLFKYGHKTSLRYNFCQYILDFIGHYNIELKNFDVMIPAPLHPARLRERGYNQALLLAQHLSQHLHIPVSSDNLIRVRHTPNQALLSEKERWTNIHRAFKIKKPEILVDQSVLIIDDLMSTGATVSEMASLLKEAGAKKVCVLTVAMAY